MVDPKGGRKRMKFSNTSVMNFENAFRGLRNPMNSWSKSDSHYSCSEEFFCKGCTVDSRCGEYKRSDDYIIGKNDMKLAQTLIKAGNEHSTGEVLIGDGKKMILHILEISAGGVWGKIF